MIALLCDVIFRFGAAEHDDPHVEIGFVMGDGGPVVWSPPIRYALSKECLITGYFMHSVQAPQVELINYVALPDEWSDRVDRFADLLAAGIVKVIRYSKMSINFGLWQFVNSIIDAPLMCEAP